MNDETPLTDAEYASHPVLDTQTGGDAVRIQFARRLERIINNVKSEAEGYADGAPDADSAAKLANRIMAHIEAP